MRVIAAEPEYLLFRDFYTAEAGPVMIMGKRRAKPAWRGR
jgi:hypothetical protein